MISVATNIPMLRGMRALDDAQGIVALAAERLATGKRINRASDDPAGLIAADNLRQERTELGGLISSSERYLHLLGAKEGALSVIEDLFHELDGLAREAANGDALAPEEREGLQVQAEAIYKTIDHLIETTSFNGKRVLADSMIINVGSTTKVQSGIKLGDLGSVTRETEDEDGELVAESFSLRDLFNDLSLDGGDVEKAVESIGAARKTITGMRAGTGTEIQQIERDISVWGGRMVSITEAESAIRDADFAKETANLIRGQMLEQAAIQMIKFAAEIPKAALSLLPGARTPFRSLN